MTELTKNAQKIVLQTEEGPRSFLGYVIVDLSLNAASVVDPPASLGWGPRYQWTDMALYRMVNHAEAQYLVYIVGNSVLYHRLNGPCHQKGAIRSVGELVDDTRYELFRPCKKPGCYPSAPWDHLEDLADDDHVTVERQRYTRHKCASAMDVVENLRDDKGDISGLALKLLQESARKDSGIAAAMTTERPL